MSLNKKKILFLFTELSGYMINCFNFALEKSFELHVVAYPVNKEAPFSLIQDKLINRYDRRDYSNSSALIKLIHDLNPGLILISGWADKDYLKAINKSSTNKKVILMDNPWKSSLKQHLWSFIFKNRYKKIFDAIWIPGKPQYKYALNLGFKNSNIFEGLYTCDDTLFNIKNLNKDNSSNTRIFLFIGRYVKEKGVEELWDNFIQLNSQNHNKWQLWCVGTGELWEDRVLDKNIKHFGFIQPDNLCEIVSKCNVYILPSKYEPWGVSLHEMVSLGMPALVSDTVGSSTCFVKDNINGFIFSHEIANDLKDKMIKIMQLSSIELNKMGKESLHLSKIISTEKWLETLNNIYD